MQNHRPASVGGLDEERLEIEVVGAHRRLVGEVPEVGGGLVGDAGTGQRLSDLVVGEHGDDVVRFGLCDVVADERAAGVPGLPALAGVHATGEILVAQADRRGGREAGGTAGGVGESELQVAERPADRLRRCAALCRALDGAAQPQQGDQQHREPGAPHSRDYRRPERQKQG